MKRELNARFFAGLMVVAALAGNDAEDCGWRSVVDSMLESDADSVLIAKSIVSRDVLDAIRLRRPRHVAFVMKPEEVDATAVRGIKRMMCDIDDDPFEDAMWGIVTGPTAEDARRVALCREPREVSCVLATTSVDERLVEGPITVISDANPPGVWWMKTLDGSIAHHSTTGDTSHVFAAAWNSFDPDLLLTSSHASERNLEMPFGRGNIVSVSNIFATVENLTMIDYSTGQAIEGQSAKATSICPLGVPKREKVWVAAGNCLIANHKPTGSDMLMSALGFGKVNQFVGYIKTTWYGEIGWNTWRYFADHGMPLNESWYASNQFLIKKLFADGADLDPATAAGLAWDFDGTAFYGNPRRRITIPDRIRRTASNPGDLPMLIVFPGSKRGRRLVSAPEGFEVFVADDFALVMAWPDLEPDWRNSLKFE